MAPIDFLILAPLDLEIAALRAAFDALAVDARFYADRTVYWPVTVARELGQRPAIVHIAQLKAPGVLNTAVTASRLLAEVRPACVVSFGIAGGFIKGIDSDVELKDVVVADQPVIYYEPAKEGRDGTEGRILPLPIDVHTLSEFLGLCRDLAKGYSLRHGPVTSGEKLISSADAPSRLTIRAVSGKALAVEMEAAGVAAAAREAAAANQHCRVLVVKGISDDADHKEASAGARPVAAQHAAELLASFVRRFRLEHSDWINPQIPNGLRDEATTFCSILAPCVSPRRALDLVSVRRTLYPIDIPPPIFYRWTFLHRHLHWVDFHFLLLIRTLLSSLPYLTVHFGIDDTQEPVLESDREHTSQLVSSMFGSNARVHWHSKLEAHRAQYVKYAQEHGFDEVTWTELRQRYLNERQSTLPGGRDGFPIISEWLQYVGWMSRYASRCVLLQWDAHGDTVERFLHHFLTLSPLVIYTPDIRLCGRPGKTSAPGKDIVIDPPQFTSLLDWLGRLPDTSAINELLRQLDVDHRFSPDMISPDEVTALIQGHCQLRERMSMVDEFTISATRLIRLMVFWNQMHFSKFLTA